MDFASEVDDETIASVRCALAQHLVLVFRGHEPPTDAQYFSFGSKLGTVLIDNITPEFKRPGFPGIGIMSNVVESGKPVGATGSAEIGWHTDYSFRPRISRMLFLEASEVPPAGGHTYFADMYSAYETLTPEVRARLASLRIVHTLEYQDDVHGPYEEHAEHPAVVTNPDTGRRALYLSKNFHPRFVGLTSAQSDQLVEQLATWSTDDRFVYEHDWESGDLVLWDSIGTQHRRDAFGSDARRYMRKMSILVDRESDPWPGAEAPRIAIGVPA